VVTLAIDALLVVVTVGSLVANFPTFHTQNSALASSQAMAVLLTVEATQRIWDVRLHRIPQVTGCDVFRRLWRCKGQYYSVSTTFAISIAYMYYDSSGHSLLLELFHCLLYAAFGYVAKAYHSSARRQ